MESTTIRAATAADAAALVPLFEQLGYPTPAETIATRLTSLDRRSAVFVAERGSTLVGFAAVAMRSDFIEKERAVLEGLVVERSARNARVGAQLLHAAESWAWAQRAGIVVVRSNVVRADAHRFYEREGYRRKKSQHIFEKRLRPTQNSK